MFFRRKFFFFAFLGLLFLGIGGMRQHSAYEMGYRQGYAAAERVENSAESSETPAPQTHYAPHHRGRHHGFGFFHFVLLFFVASTFMRCMDGKRHGWHHHRHGGGEPKEKQPEDVEPDIRVES